MKATTALVLCLLLPLAAAGAPSVGDPVVYVSPDGQGTPPPDPIVPIAPLNDQPLYLFIDYDNDPDAGPSSMTGTMCVNEDGDETCAFDVRLELTTDAATFDTFTPAGPKIVGRIEPATRTSLRVNAIDVDGMALPAEIGTLTVDALGANLVQISVVGVHRVGAAGQLDAIQPRVIAVPEPGGELLLYSGIAALAALHCLRRGRAMR